MEQSTQWIIQKKWGKDFTFGSDCTVPSSRLRRLRSPAVYRSVLLIGQSPSCQVCPKFPRDLSQATHGVLLRKHGFPDCQYGFLPKRSTVWQLLSITNDWAQAIDHGKRVHACFLDVAKAFDRVDHNILEVKLSSIGVRGSCLQWFSSYLRGRKIRTKIDGTLSEAKSISSGVPQGSVLGPLLFHNLFHGPPCLVCNQRVLSLLMIPFCMTSTAWEILSHHHAAPSRTTWCDLTPGPTTAMCSSIRKRAAQMYIARRQARTWINFLHLP